MASTPASRPGSRIALVCLFAALSASGALIALPLPVSPVPIVVQNLFVVLSGLLLGPLEGGLATALFLGLGALGFPVFSGGRGGIALFAGPTGGYLVGYLLASIVAGFLGRRRTWVRTILGAVGAFALILACGVVGLHLVKGADWTKALAVGLLPFLPGDTLKAILAVILAMKLGPFMDSLRCRGRTSVPDGSNAPRA